TVDARGAVHDGDFVLALAARHFARHGQLDPKLVVGTVMSNGGLEATLARDGIELVRTKVGDRYVWGEMVRTGARFGGEPAGHGRGPRGGRRVLDRGAPRRGRAEGAELRHVRDRRIRRPPRGPAAADGRPASAGIPRLRLRRRGGTTERRARGPAR